MTQRIYVDRSRYETAQRCLRARWYEYHESGMGITSSRKPLPLAVGASVHRGLEILLREMIGDEIPKLAESWAKLEEAAVRSALTDFSQYQSAIDLGDELSLPAGFERSAVDEYLYREQCALVEAMIRAYARRRLRPLLEQYEVLEVEREGEWTLAEGCEGECVGEIRFMSRPDALLRERATNALYLLSYKTAASWDARKARDAEHDMQGMSEGIEIERRLAEWWHTLRSAQDVCTISELDALVDRLKPIGGIGKPMLDFLRSLDAPPRILGVRYEYMLKGERWRDRELSERYGIDMRSQKSHLVRAYEAISTPQRGTAEYSVGDKCWSWDYIRDDGKPSSLGWQNWKSRPVYESMTIREWIDLLDSATVTMSGEDSTMGLEPRELGYSCAAQSLGCTLAHPLDAIFIPPIIIYRNEDELRDLVDQMEAQERRIAEGVAAVRGAESQRDDGETRHALNVHFPQTRRACEYPGTCAYVKLCYGGDVIRRDPVASGLYRVRKPNHPQEASDADSTRA